MTLSPPTGEASSPRALIVEDEQTIVRLMRRLLEELGLSVTDARNGREGWERFETAERPFDILVSDLVMPEVGGREMIDRIRAVTPDLPILITSGTGDAAVRDLLSRPTIVFLAKPFDASAFKERVRQLLSVPAAGARRS